MRMLLKRPGFTATALLTLAFGDWRNTAIFSIIHGVLLRPLPYPEPDQLVTLWESSPEQGTEQGLVSGPNFLDWRRDNTVFSSLAVSPGWQGSTEFNLLQRDRVRKIRGTYTSASFFTTLAVHPLMGRTFVEEEDRKEGNRVAVLSHGFWQTALGADRDIVGKTLVLDSYGRRDYTVIGVMPEGFEAAAPCDVWLPLGWMGVTLDERRSAHWHTVIGRLKRGVTIEEARSQMNTIQGRLKEQHPGDLIASKVAVVPLLEQAVGRTAYRALLVLWGVVAGVLLIACANVANLLLARAAERQKEVSLRVALGASRWRVMQQLLVESLTLAGAGGLLGTLLASWVIQAFVAASPIRVPRLSEISLDGTALAFTAGISILTGVIFGLAPAWQCWRGSLNDALKATGRTTSASLSAKRLRHLLVVAEVAVSLMLLTGAGLMLRSFARLATTNHGFRSEHVLTAVLDYSVSGYTTWTRPTATRPQITQHELLERLRRYPNVVAAAVTGDLPRQGSSASTQTILIEGRVPKSVEDLPRTRFQPVSPGYFKTMGMPILRGRDFTEDDNLAAPGVVLINETMARRHFAGSDPIGQRLGMPDRQNPMIPAVTPAWDRQGPWREIIGIVPDTKSLSQRPEPGPQAYVPYWQWPMQNPTVVLRAAGNPTGLASVLRTELKLTVPDLPEPVIRTMDDILAETRAEPRFQAWSLSVFAAVAMGLAAVGLYGVLAYSVVQRTQEIAIRIALGAPKWSVLWLVFREGMAMTLAGVVVGLAAALALTRVMGSLLYEIQPADPVSFAAVSLLLLTIAAAACLVPARRAARVDPLRALACE
ncbi:MAG: ABC transporter permease [Verrucomicrobiota bacterium]